MNDYNPDVLLCLANLSNDEVFTPPQLANEVLDLLPKEIWENKNTKFLDPCCKTGVFLREITIRLIKGLKDEIPDLQERVNHILTNQVYGIAITELTALTTRRTLYCSKDANGEFSICTTFGHPEGNIYYRRIEHDWKNGICSLCGASQSEYDRSVHLETYAYAFIHKPIEELFNVKFDVIIGNPPYQLSVSGNNKRSIPLYHKFVEQAIKLNPKYITMIIPSRWFSLPAMKNFRATMFDQNKLEYLVDFLDSNSCFSDVDIKGGVCYFLWNNRHDGPCNVKTIKSSSISTMTRYLTHLETNVFIRHNEAIPILEKVLSFQELSFSTIVSKQKPFGLPTNYTASECSEDGDLKVHAFKKKMYAKKDEITKNTDLIDLYKLFTPKAVGSGVMGCDRLQPILGSPGEICTETYLVVGASSDLNEVLNILSYTQTNFFHFMWGLKKITQDALNSSFELIPMQDFSKPWTDEELYKKYGLTQEEIDYIESMIRPMGLPEIKEN